MLEIEIKFPVEDLRLLEDRIQRECGAVELSSHEEADHYFNAPDRDFARTDEALRLRRIGSANYVTYKGPKRDSATKTRTELEVPLAAGDQTAEDFLRLLRHLGYKPVAVVRKARRTFRLTCGGFDMNICLDQVEGVGAFAELEIVADEESFEPAQSALLDLARRLYLTVSERRSYLELLLLAQGKTG
jgi:adenylate cyclase class 2